MRHGSLAGGRPLRYLSEKDRKEPHIQTSPSLRHRRSPHISRPGEHHPSTKPHSADEELAVSDPLPSQRRPYRPSTARRHQ